MTAGALELSRAEVTAARYLCGDNEALWDLVQRVAGRQPASVRWHRRAEAAVSALPSQLPFSSPLLPPCVADAAGARITDLDGNEYVDCHMAYTAGLLGHRPARMLEAVRAALGHGLGAGHFFEAQVELAELVKAMVPGVERVAFFSAGADAVSAAVRMARAMTGRPLVAKFEGCYHGWHEVGLYNPMMLLSGRQPVGQPDDIAPVAATAGLSVAVGGELVILPFNAEAALDTVRRRAAELACVVVDPLPPFMADWPEDARSFVSELRAVTTACDVPLVLDEVVSGFRLAKGGAQEAYGMPADAATFGKITSGLGFPLAMVAGQGRLLDSARTDGLFADYARGKAWVTNTHTAAHPAVVASLAQLRWLDEDHGPIMSHLDRLHGLLRDEVADLAASEGIAVRVHGHPRLQSMVVFGDASPHPADRNYRAVVARASPGDLRAMLALSLYLRLEGVYVKTMPTMNLSAAHTEADVEVVVTGLRRSLLAMRASGLLPG